MSVAEVESDIKLLVNRYHAECALLFGAYARGDATPDSDVDVIVIGGPNFRKMNIFAFAEDIREMTGKYGEFRYVLIACQIACAEIICINNIFCETLFDKNRW